MKNVGINVHSTAAVHAFAWLAYTAVMVLHNTTKYDGTGIGKILTIMPLCMIVVYFVRWVCRRLVRTGKRVRTIGWLVLFYAGGLLVGCGYINWLENSAGVAVHLDGAGYTQGRFVRNVLLFYLRYTSYGVGVFLLENVLRLAFANRNLMKEAADLKHMLETASARPASGRIALHFLGNALQRCYRLLQGVPHQTVAVMQRVDGLVNYALDEYAEQKARLVRVEKELQRLREMMALDRTGKPGGPCVVLHVEGNTSGLKVPPFTFISAYENILKHGITDDRRTPAVMRLVVFTGGYRFETFNKVADESQPYRIKGGYGLPAIQQRLEQTLGKRYTFECNEQGGHYRLKLEVWS